MSNRIDNVINGLISSLTTAMVKADGTGDLKAIVTRLLDPVGEAAVPVMSVLDQGSRCLSGSGAIAQWETTLLMSICVRNKQAAAPATLNDLMAKVVHYIRAFNDLTTAGGQVKMPGWYNQFDLRVAQSTAVARGQAVILTSGDPYIAPT